MRTENRYNKTLLRWNYSVIPEKYYHVDIGNYSTYGLKVTGLDYESVLHDVSICEETTSNIALFLNQHQLPPSILKDVVCTMLDDCII